MGRFKPLLPLGGETVLERVIRNFRVAGIQKLLVVVGYRTEDLIPILNRHAVDWIRNPDYHGDMFLSVRIGARNARPASKAFFLMPADIPFIKPRTLTKLLQAFVPENMDILRPCHQGNRGHPPLISASVIPHILNFHEPGGLRNLCIRRQLKSQDLEIDDPGVLEDLDTWHDYERALKNHPITTR
jgi:CTP:molybdopterin cytidylyltransferase MocA